MGIKFPGFPISNKNISNYIVSIPNSQFIKSYFPSFNSYFIVSNSRMEYFIDKISNSKIPLKFPQNLNLTFRIWMEMGIFPELEILLELEVSILFENFLRLEI